MSATPPGLAGLRGVRSGHLPVWSALPNSLLEFHKPSGKDSRKSRQMRRIVERAESCQIRATRKTPAIKSIWRGSFSVFRLTEVIAASGTTRA